MKINLTSCYDDMISWQVKYALLIVVGYGDMRDAALMMRTMPARRRGSLSPESAA